MDDNVKSSGSKKGQKAHHIIRRDINDKVMHRHQSFDEPKVQQTKRRYSGHAIDNIKVKKKEVLFNTSENFY